MKHLDVHVVNIFYNFHIDKNKSLREVRVNLNFFFCEKNKLVGGKFK